MLGREIDDPHGLEGAPSTAKGLSLLDVETRMEPEKAVRNVEALSEVFSARIDGYEIHIGQTAGADCGRPFSRTGSKSEGAVSRDGRVMGTYLHGLFGNDEFRANFLKKLGIMSAGGSYWRDVDAALDAIAGELEALGLGAVLDAAR
jgi:adenosylcobyric acid synthase